MQCGSFPEPCANGGICLSLSQGQGTCQCAPGFLGETCQFPDPCQDAQICQNGGSCQALLPTLPSSPSLPSPLAPSFFCTCPSGFTGDRCQAQLKDPCASFCSKMGRCHIQASGRPQCSCMPGWTGVCLATYPQIQCRCPPGFEGHACERDVNECFLDPGPCPKGTSCHNTLGSFQCLCPAGNGGTCQNSAGGFHCVCVSGWGGTGCEENLDDCVAATCAPGSTCIDRVGSFSCLCPPGRTGLLCHMEDMCLSQPCHQEAQCNTNPLRGSTFCVCQPGYTGPTCHQDLDECQMAQQGPSPCEHGGSCLNTPGSFECLCPPGYTGSRCEADHNECLSQPCHPGSTCLDLLATFQCLCPPGLEGQLCEVETDECASAPCLNEADCQDLLNGFRCVCRPGFTGSQCEEDINECRSSPCANGGQCQDQPGSFHCKCLPGFEGPRCQAEVDECLSGPCPTGASCLDLPGAFLCLCPSGFTGHLCEIPLCAPNLCQPKQRCQDPEEEAHCLCPSGSPGCAPAEDNCTCHHGHCQRSSCVCDVGWTGPECDTELGGCVSTPCAHGGTCHPQPFGYNCTCATGYTGPTCSEELTACHSGPCLNGGSCSPSPEGYSCTCPPSHTGLRCQTSIDHCASGECPPCPGAGPQEDGETGQAPCLHGGTCVNRPSASSCLCTTGFQGPRCEGRIRPSCADSPCRNRATCQDGPQGPRCLCPPGYTGGSCQTLMDSCAQKPCPHNSRCLQTGPSFQCLCLQGWTGPLCNLPLSSCQKAALSQAPEHPSTPLSFINPCVSLFPGTEVSSLCQNGGICIDSGPSHFCHCPPGFQGSICQERVNPCESRPCQHGATCVAQPNGYLCQCTPGYSGQNCSKEPDACQSQPCHNHGTCTPKPGGFHCACPPGFVGLRCEGDVDECLDQPCHPTGTAACHSLANAFYCQCLPGHTGQRCEVELDPCQSQPCSHGGSCEATAGPPPGFTCHCPQVSDHKAAFSVAPNADARVLKAPPAATEPPPAVSITATTVACVCPPPSLDSHPAAVALLLHAYTMAAAQRPLGWGAQAFDAPALPALQGPGVRGLEQRDVRAEVEMGPATLAAAAQEEIGMVGTAPWGSQTPGRAAPPILGAGFSSGMGSAIRNATLKSVCLMAMTVRLLQPALQPMTSTAVITSTMDTWGPSLALLVVLSPSTLDQQLLALARVLSLTLRVGLWVRKDSDGRNMVYPYPGAQAEEELGGTPDPSHHERAAPQTQPTGKETDSLSTGFVVVMDWGPWSPYCQDPCWLPTLVQAPLIRRKRREHGALWLPPGFTRRSQTQPVPRRRRPPLGEDSIGLKALKPEAEIDEDGVVMCSGPKEGEEADQVEEMASPSKCQLWPLSSDCQELPQAAMLTPPQDSEMDVPDVDTRGPDGVTPLMSAVCCGGVESRTYQETWLGSPEPWEPLLGGGACPQVHTVGTGETPLHLAARFSRPTAAHRLLEAGADPNQPDRAGRTPLHTAVAADAREVCQLLLRSRQTAVDARTEDGTTALMLAARLAVEDLVEELIAAQADVGARDKWGMDLGKLITMPHCPSRAPVTSLEQRFLQAGGHPGNASALEGPGGLNSPSPKSRIRGKQEPRRKTALHWAAAVNNARAARSLLQAGADKDALDG
ncbi:hypothetical protein E2I00_011764, partial [Balaenoptera physalus]